mgnify:CR=1 FL=1|jgi:phage-related protein
MSRFSIDAVFNAVDRFTAPVNRMQNRVKKFSLSATASLKRVDRGLSAIIKGAGRFSAVAAGAIAAIGSAAFAAVTAINKTTSRTSRMSEAVGVSVDTVEGLAGAISGAGFEVDNIIDLVEEMNNKLGESRGLQQTLPVQESLAVLNLSFKELKDLAPEEQFKRITDAALQMSDAQKAASAVDILMGGEANKVISVLRQQGKSVDEIVARYNALNLQTEESRRGAMRFTDAIGFTTRFISSLGQLIAGLIGGRLEPLLQRFQEFVAANKELIQLKVSQWVDKVVDSVVYLVENFETIAMWTKRIAIGLGVFIAFSAILKTFIAIMTAVNIVMAMNPVGLIVLGITALIAAIAAAIVYWDELKDAFLGLSTPVKIAIAAVMGPIGWFIAAATLIKENWTSIKTFFVDLWTGVKDVFESVLGGVFDWFESKTDGIISAFKSAMETIKGIFRDIMAFYDKTVGMISEGVDSIGGFFGFGDDEDEQGAGANGVPLRTVGPQERTARMITESNRTERSEVVIRDETGRAEVTRTSGSSPLVLSRSGGF